MVPGFLRESLHELKTDVKEIRGILLGDGEHKGFRVRIDRLEQAELRRSRMLWAMLIAVIGVLLERVVG